MHHGEIAIQEAHTVIDYAEKLTLFYLFYIIRRRRMFLIRFKLFVILPRFLTFLTFFCIFLVRFTSILIAASGHRETTTASSRRHLSGGRGLLPCVMSS